MLGRILHLAFDAVLVSAALAGIKRSSGLSINVEQIKNEEIQKAVKRYLDFGDWTLDQGIAVASSSPWFKRETR